MSQCEHRPPLPGDIEYPYRCPICALEKRVEELSQRMTGLEMKRIEPMTIQLAPSPEPKLYSGFTADEWQQMLKDGPLLCDTSIGGVWIDRLDDKCLGSQVLCSRGHWFNEIKLLEQPNWRPHMTDECPVLGRVRVDVCFADNSLSKGADIASNFIWIRNGHYSDIHAYRILGT